MAGADPADGGRLSTCCSIQGLRELGRLLVDSPGASKDTMAPASAQPDHAEEVHVAQTDHAEFSSFGFGQAGNAGKLGANSGESAHPHAEAEDAGGLSASESGYAELVHLLTQHGHLDADSASAWHFILV